eukprot:2680655-Amphidinium_carterae.1
MSRVHSLQALFKIELQFVSPRVFGDCKTSQPPSKLNAYEIRSLSPTASFLRLPLIFGRPMPSEGITSRTQNAQDKISYKSSLQSLLGDALQNLAGQSKLL